MRKLASIAIVNAVSPIPDAERLEIATMKGKAWQVVVGKGDFHPGDKVVYFEIDSALPADDDKYAFLKERCLKEWKLGGKVLEARIRIRTMKLRGVVSQGLVMPISAFPRLSDKSDGTDVTEELGVGHYDEINDRWMAILAPGFESGDRKGNFPSWIPKTDEERIQNLAEWPEKLKGVMWEVTEKCDGSSMTVFFAPGMRPDDPFGVCGRNYELKRGASTYWKTAEKYGLEEKLRQHGGNIALQGELVGPGVNGNRDRLAGHEFRVFRIWNIADSCFMPSGERVAFCKELGIPHVPVISPAMDIFTECPTVDDVLKFAEGKTANGNEREGLVFKQAGSELPLSFKAVSNRYLLKGK